MRTVARSRDRLIAIDRAQRSCRRARQRRGSRATRVTFDAARPGGLSIPRLQVRVLRGPLRREARSRSVARRRAKGDPRRSTGGGRRSGRRKLALPAGRTKCRLRHSRRQVRSRSLAFQRGWVGHQRAMSAEEAPSRPSEFGAGSLWDVVKRTVQEFREDNLTDWAAALTYYGILAIFPALIVFVSIIGLIGAPVTEPLLETIGAFAPSEAKDILTNAVEGL